MITRRNIKALYFIETSHPLQKVGEMMAGEQSSGTFVRLPGETAVLKNKYGAVVEDIQELGMVPYPSLPGSKRSTNQIEGYQRAEIKIAWPYDNIGADISALMAAVAGNLYELGPMSGIKLLDIEIPDEFMSEYRGPGFGIEGTRKLCQVYDRPIIGTIIKPSVGLTPEETAGQVKILVEAGLDFIKDDELMADPPHSPFTKRVEAIMKVLNDHALKTGRMPMYAFNLSGEIDDMKRRHDLVVKNGGTCVMANINWVGITGLLALSGHSQVPIHGHRNFWGALSRHPLLGMDFVAYQKIFSICGVDQLHTNGIRNKFCESDESVIRSVRACLNPEHGGFRVMPVISSGQWAEQALDTHKAIGNLDLMYLCGGGITAHPGGMDAGVRSIRIAWEEAVRGNSIFDVQDKYSEIRQAIDFYGKNT
ncbi:MAG: ribulose-bisphosphate carboxylase large subunit family protein [Cyclobacteriaceae bacterium]|nr:ribulose-bisphosphate carboxylase large subunit family protein [Cyclobacteriaceae bacterium]